ncbi:hypothetical protein ACQEXU_13265 [Vibrio sp. TRT 21S02]|uniref:hypothetical protein n=1 Tax=Vibrio sp. TRT 21S02 TaxID=3418507 RepID=UPI003CECCFC0
MSILKIQRQLPNQNNKLSLYRSVVSQPLPLPQVMSFVRIGGQLTGEQSALNTQILSQLRPLKAANDPIY